MWLPLPPPVTDRWVLHIAATPHQVDEVLADLCIHKRAHAIGDPGCPAYLAGRETPQEPPAWMSFAKTELERRGYRTLWCDPGCKHHPQPQPTAGTIGAGRKSRRATPRTPLRLLTAGAPHHRAAGPLPRPGASTGAPRLRRA
nr:hypothetical protein [uncultured Actinoplanes sp.]